jgi:predicted alpha/beta hydrolase family esterase
MGVRTEANGSALTPSRSTTSDGSDVAVLMMPGYRGSGPAHWQTLWEQSRPDIERVLQVSWHRPRLGDWAVTLERAVSARRRVVLVAHSLACALVAQWARCGSVGRVASALLVAPADVDRSGRSPELASFAPMPLELLPFPTWVVASSNDPYVSRDRASAFAFAWGARFIDAGRIGHINVDSGHGDWPEGAQLLEELLAATQVGRCA